MKHLISVTMPARPSVRALWLAPLALALLAVLPDAHAQEPERRAVPLAKPMNERAQQRAVPSAPSAPAAPAREVRPMPAPSAAPLGRAVERPSVPDSRQWSSGGVGVAPPREVPARPPAALPSPPPAQIRRPEAPAAAGAPWAPPASSWSSGGERRWERDRPPGRDPGRPEGWSRDRGRDDNRWQDRGWDSARDRSPAERWAKPPAITRAPQGHYLRPGQPVVSLPPRAHHTIYGGSRFWFHQGIWYAPYGASYIVVRPPAGVFVSLLPAGYRIVPYGSQVYYYAYDVFYVSSGNGYRVVAPPPGIVIQEDEFVYEPLIVYPRLGQSPQQQAQDEYECHEWAVHQSGYDPSLAAVGQGQAYDERAVDQYTRAFAACLEARGYVVK